MKYGANLLLLIVKRRPPRGGAWIEICRSRRWRWCRWVAPPRGGRGLKSLYIMALIRADGVAPLAGAWIEMSVSAHIQFLIVVAPLAGGVD